MRIYIYVTGDVADAFHNRISCIYTLQRYIGPARARAIDYTPDTREVFFFFFGDCLEKIKRVHKGTRPPTRNIENFEIIGFTTNLYENGARERVTSSASSRESLYIRFIAGGP